MSSPNVPVPSGNRILDRLPEEEQRNLLAAAETVSLPHGREIFRQDGPASHVYFPVQSVFSLVVLMEEGKAIEAATVGNEGMIGLPVYLDLDFSPFLSVSQVAGEALRVPAAEFLEAVRTGETLDRLTRRFTAYSLREATQNVGCNAVHSVEERMCRWLLMTHDRAGKNEFALTHEFLAEMLGVRRQTITAIAGNLQRSGILSYRRGLVQVIDRMGLEAATCECYATTKTLYDRIMFSGEEHGAAHQAAASHRTNGNGHNGNGPNGNGPNGNGPNGNGPHGNVHNLAETARAFWPSPQ